MPNAQPRAMPAQQARLTDAALRRSVEGLLEPWLETATREELDELHGVINRQLAERAGTKDRAA